MAFSPFAMTTPLIAQYHPSPITSSRSADAGKSALPSMPAGKSTVVGGAIQKVDPVRDQLTLKVFGGSSMKILYDERTQVYRDGAKIPLASLGPVEHASIQTVLDGTDIFAEGIHILSQSPEGDCQGQIVEYNAGSGELTLNDTLTHRPIKVRVSPSTTVAHVGQSNAGAAGSGLSELHSGTLISAKFESNGKGEGILTHVDILATPGSEFVFRGSVSFVNLATQVMAVTDPRDGKNYSITFDANQLPESRNLHDGARVTVTATFDGTKYVARELKISQ
jgi:hypothetical protein